MYHSAVVHSDIKFIFNTKYSNIGNDENI